MLCIGDDPAPELCVRLTALPWFETLMLVTRLGSTPKIWAMMSAVIAFPAASHAGDTMVVTLALRLSNTRRRTIKGSNIPALISRGTALGKTEANRDF